MVKLRYQAQLKEVYKALYTGQEDEVKKHQEHAALLSQVLSFIFSYIHVPG